MRVYRRYRDISKLLLCTTMLSSALVPTALHAAGLDAVNPPRAASKANGSLTADQKRELAGALRQGERALIALAYDQTYREPGLRDSVVRHVARLAPAALRDVTTAADLGVLTSGQPMALAPTSERMLQTRTANADVSVNSADSYTARASNNSPNLPNPQPSLFSQTWNLTMIGASAAYNRGFTGAGVSVVVADTGFDTTNAALVNRLNIGLARNYVVKDGGTYDPSQLTPQTTPDKVDIHGSHVAGIVAAEKFDNVNAHGVAYDATVIPVRTITETGFSIASGIDGSAASLNYFASLPNVMVYNASYGPSSPPGTPPQLVWANSIPTESETAAVLNVLKAGKLIIAATGNERKDDPVAARNPSGMALYPYIQPAHANTNVYSDGGAGTDLQEMLSEKGMIIGVMSVNSSKQAASYSNYCGVTASWCVAAPGGDAVYENSVYVSGDRIYSTVPVNTYGYAEGTSMAAPTVSGAIAVLIQANPNYNAQDLARLMFSTTEDLGLPGVDAVYGYGLIRLDRATEGPTTLAAGQTVSVAAGNTSYWSRPLTTSGSFTKDGDGILTIAGRTAASGSVFAALGTLAVDGTLSVANGSSLTVAQPATLAGFGVINGNTTISGTLSPGKMANTADLIGSGEITPGTTLLGNSVGMLTFNGSVTLAPTATTRIDIDGTRNIPGGPGTFDRIIVSGAGNVFWAAGTLTPVLRGSVGTVSNYTPAIGAQFAFVEAQDGARTAGTFASLIQPTSGLPANGRFDLLYGATAITLRVTPASFSGLVNTDQLGNSARSVATILDGERAASGTMPTANEKALFDALYNLDTEEKFDKALSQLGGPGQPAVSSAPLQAFAGFLGAVGDRQDTLAFGGQQGQNGAAQSFALSYAGRNVMSAETAASNAFASLTPVQTPQDGWSLWGQGFGRTSRVGDSGELAGSKAVSGGFTVGADRAFANNLIAGGAFGYARTSATSTDIRGTSDTYAGAVYASWTPGAAIVDFRIAAGPSQISTTRQMILTSSALQGSTNGIGLGTSLEAGYRIALTPDVVLKPYAGVSWQGFRRDGYSESQLPFGLVYAAQTYDRLTTTAGLAASARLRTAEGATLVPELKLGWGYDLRDTTLVSSAALLDESFSVSAAQPGRNAALVGAKISGWRSENFRLFAAYNGEFRGNAESHQLSGGARLSW